MLVGSGCKPKTEAPPPAPPVVQVVAVVSSNVPVYREWVGTVDSEVNASITAQVSGYLLSRNYQEGAKVTNGQVLFQIDPAPFEATLARAQGQLGEARARKGKTELDVQRYTPLAARQAVSQQELDNAVQADKAAAAEVESAQAEVKQAEINLGFTTIRSPLNGVAGMASITQAQVGNLVGPSSGPLTTVTKIDPIRVYFSLSQQLLTEMQERKLAEGLELRGDDPSPDASLELILAAGTVYPPKGKVIFGNNQVDVRTGTISVVGEFPNPDGLLVPGMFTRVRATVGMEKDALLVPQRAVTDVQGRSLVAVVDADNKVSIRPVTPGERVGSAWVVKGDLKAGDRVVAEGIQKVRDGVAVNPVAPQPGTTNAAPSSAP